MSRNAQLQIVLFALLALAGRVRADDALPMPTTNAVARVVLAQGENLFDAYLAHDDRVEEIFNRGLLHFTRTTNVSAAWRSLVATNDTVGIKVFAQPGPLNGTHPAIIAAIARGLLAAGLPPDHIIIWDKHARDLQTSGFFKLGAALGVRVASAVETGYDEKTFYLPDSPVIGQLNWGDLEFGRTNADHNLGKKSFVTKLVSQQITKLISVAPLINENDAGTCGHFFSLALGSVDNTRSFEGDAHRLAVALPELIALPQIGDRTVLYITDALLGQYQGGPASFLQYSTILQQLWFSHDPVALDTLALKELARERAAAMTPPTQSNLEIYTNATLLQLGFSNPNRIQIEKVR